MNQRVTYFLTCATKAFLRKRMECPSCGYSYSDVIDSKFFVTKLRRCQQCQLLYRTPITTASENASFYQEEYEQGFTTEVPNIEQLNSFLDCGFAHTEKDYATYIGVLEAVGAKQGNRLFDFGCSWGYGSWQLQKHGFLVESFEISIRRADFARKNLALKVYSSLSEVSGSFDIFFSSHVLEHVPSVRESINFGLGILRPRGLFVALTPNGSEQRRIINPYSWHKLWGRVHPNFLDETYYKKMFSDKSYILSSNPYDLQKLREWRNAQNVQTVLALGGDELLAVARV